MVAAARLPDLSTAPTKPRRAKPPKGAPAAKVRLSVEEAATVAGVSLQTLYRAIQSGFVPAKKRGARMLIERDVLLRLAPMIRKHAPGRARQREDGETARDAFKRFALGETLVDVVEAMAIDPASCKQLWNQWLELQEIHRTAVRMTCECGAPPDPRTAHCKTCAPRTRVLSTAQLAVLAGAVLGREDVVCDGCQKPTSSSLARHLCTGCKAALVVRDGRLVVVAGVLELAALSIVEVERMIAPYTTPAPAPRDPDHDAKVAELLRPTSPASRVEVDTRLEEAERALALEREKLARSEAELAAAKDKAAPPKAQETA